MTLSSGYSRLGFVARKLDEAEDRDCTLLVDTATILVLNVYQLVNSLKESVHSLIRLEVS